MSNPIVDKLLGAFDNPENAGEVEAAMKGFLRELDTMANTDSKAYAKMIKDLGQGAGVDMPDDFFQRIAGETTWAGVIRSPHNSIGL
jgi:hypothetical protein